MVEMISMQRMVLVKNLLKISISACWRRGVRNSALFFFILSFSSVAVFVRKDGEECVHAVFVMKYVGEIYLKLFHSCD